MIFYTVYKEEPTNMSLSNDDRDGGEEPTQEEMDAMMMEDEDGANEETPQEEGYDENGLDEEQRLALAAGEIDGEEEEMADCALQDNDEDCEELMKQTEEVSAENTEQQEHLNNSVELDSKKDLSASSESTKALPQDVSF